MTTMKKFLPLKFSAFIICFFLIGCNQTNPLPNEYVVSESMVNQYLERYLGQEQSIGLSGVGKASLSFNNFNVDIGREEVGKVALSGGINFSLSSIIRGPSAGFDIKIKARPVYDAEDGAIYLKDLELNSFKLNSNFGSVNTSTLLPYLNSALKFYFDKRPVYALNSQTSAFKNAIPHMQIESGEIVFRLRE